MLDLKALEADPDAVQKALERRGEIAGLDRVMELAKKRRAAILQVQTDQTERNEVNQKMKGASKEEIDKNRAALKELSSKIKEGEAEVKRIEEELETLLLGIPNPPRDEVPTGDDEESNQILETIGTPREFDFDVKDHVEIGQALGLLDAERAAKVSGSRFCFLRGKGAKLERALAAFMLDFHEAQGDTELAPPYLVNTASMTGTSQLPKFADDAFRVPRGDAEPLYLIPTAEVPVTNYFADEILDEEELPVRFFAFSSCFRAEAGAAGRDTRGLIRQHQFQKVEMVRFATPDQADAELEAMVARASQLLSDLELPHRTSLLCTGDLGFGSEKTIDVEVWLPGQQAYREISSCSTFGTFQARRAKIRYRPPGEGKKKPKPRPLVTLNGSGLAVGRTLVALLENHQQKDGSVSIPAKLRPYLGGRETL